MTTKDYDPNKNYATAIHDAIRRGDDPALVAQLLTERGNKIRANPDYYREKGVEELDSHGVAAVRYITSAAAAEEGTGADWLNRLYAQNLTADLAALRADYEGSAADLGAQRDVITGSYAAAKNQTAAQNRLQRRELNETAAYRGLNTGAAGQLALGQSAAYQGAMADLNAQEAVALTENARALDDLTAAYRAAVTRTRAEGSAAQAKALYDEYVRRQEQDTQNYWKSVQLAQQQAERRQEQENFLTRLAYEQQGGTAEAPKTYTAAQAEIALETVRKRRELDSVTRAAIEGHYGMPAEYVLEAMGIGLYPLVSPAGAVEDSRTAEYLEGWQTHLNTPVNQKTQLYTAWSATDGAQMITWNGGLYLGETGVKKLERDIRAANLTAQEREQLQNKLDKAGIAIRLQ